MKKVVLIFCAVAGLGLQSMAQGPGSAFWTVQASGFATPSRGIRDIEIPSTNVAWAVAYDGSSATPPASQDFTRTINGGTTWTAGNIGTIGANHNFSNISALDANTAWVAMYNDGAAGGGKILKTINGGTTWTHQPSATYAGAAAFPNIVHMFDANNGWTQGDPNGGYYEMYTTTNGGTTWTRVPTANIPAPLAGEFGLVDCYSTVGTTIFFGTNMGRVFKSTNGGLNWTLGGTTGLSQITDMAFSNGNYGLVRDADDLRRTVDGGLTWTAVPYSGVLYTNDLDYVPGTTNTFVSTGSGPVAQGASGSSYSINGGVSWIDYDNGNQRLAVKFLNQTVGYTGGFNTDAVTYGIFKFNGTVVSGLKDAEFSKNLSVFPNPSNGLVQVKLDNGTGSNVTINVTDALGRSVFTKTESMNGGSFNKQIDLNHLGKGVYMLQVQTGENNTMRKIVIE
jgi:hypothetical protein